jgi:hypothetical protein
MDHVRGSFDRLIECATNCHVWDDDDGYLLLVGIECLNGWRGENFVGLAHGSDHNSDIVASFQGDGEDFEPQETGGAGKGKETFIGHADGYLKE